MDQEQIYIKLAEEVRQACLDAAREGFQDASMRGLCKEGALEAAVGSIQSLDIQSIINRLPS